MLREALSQDDIDMLRMACIPTRNGARRSDHEYLQHLVFAGRVPQKPVPADVPLALDRIAA